MRELAAKLTEGEKRLVNLVLPTLLLRTILAFLSLSHQFANW